MSNIVEIDVRSKATGDGFDSAEKRAGRFGGTLGRLGGIADKAGSGIGKVAKGAGVVGLALSVAGGAAIKGGIDLTNYAGRLDLMDKKAKTVFGGNIGQVENWASKNAHAMGLTKREAVGLAAGMADLLKPMGFTASQAATMSTKVGNLTGALSEWSGGTKSAAEVGDILNAALLGERDGLQAVGISISQAQVDAQVLANKKKGLKFATEEQAQAQATLDLIMGKSTDAQKAYADGAGSLARKTAESKARMKELGETIVTQATPMLMQIGDAVQKHVLPLLERFVNWVAGPGKFKIAESFLDMGLAATGFAKVMGPILKTISMMFLNMVGNLINGAAEAFGWVPEVGPKLKGAADKFNTFRGKTEKAFDDVIAKANDWDRTLRNAKDTVTLKANISDLETKLKTAKQKLLDPKLTATQKAKLTAEAKALYDAVNRAKQKLAELPKSKTVTIYANRYETTIRRQTASGGGHAPGTYRVGGISHAAEGGPRGDWTLLGEDGPEFAKLPPGTHIKPNANTRQMMRQGAPQPVVIKFDIGRTDALGRALMEWFRKQIKTEGGDVQVVLGP